jgi:hypothetical protein
MNDQQKQEYVKRCLVLNKLHADIEDRVAVQIKKGTPGIGWRNEIYPISSIFTGIHRDLKIVEQHMRGDKKTTDEQLNNSINDIVIRLAHLRARRLNATKPV